MTPKQYLQKLLFIDEQINSNIEVLDRFKQRAFSLGGFSDSERVQTSNKSDFTDIVVKIADLEKKLDGQIDVFVNLKDQIMREINGLDNGLYSVILIKKYVQKKNLLTISRELHYSFDRMKHLHGEALESFKNTYPDKFQ